MSPEVATKFALTAMERWGLVGWRFVIDVRPKRRLGQCRYRSREVAVSEYHMLGSVDWLVEDTILHEIAHALVGQGHGHDGVWKAKCKEIGARPERCKDGEELEGLVKVERREGKWIADCTCGRTHFIHRSRNGLPPKGYYCLRTRKTLEFRPNVVKPVSRIEGGGLFD